MPLEASGLGLADAVASATSFKFGLFVTLGSVVTIASGWLASVMLIRKRVLQDTPTALIRSASQGYVELQGYAELMEGDAITAPLSSRTCIWHRHKVEEIGKNRSEAFFLYFVAMPEWRTIDSGVSGNLFYLVDSTGRCAVDPDGAKVTPSARDVWYGNNRIPGRLKRNPRWLRFTGLAQIGRHYRYTEERIEPGDPLYALGDFTTHRGAGTAFDRGDDVRELLAKWKQDNTILLAQFDANNDGEIDMNEWEAARNAAQAQVDQRRADLAAAPPVDVLGHASGSRNPFILAARTEAQMLARFHWFAVGLCAFTLFSSTTVLWLLTVR